MSEYKRLTNNNTDEYDPEYDFCIVCKYFGEPNGCNRQNGTCSNYERFIETYNRLAELEDKIENGTLYDFPFRIGQEVYIVCDWDIGEAVKGIITEIELTTNKNGTFHRIYVDHKYIFSKTNPNVVQYRYIFTKKELFLTKEEAEARLKELQEEKK